MRQCFLNLSTRRRLRTNVSYFICIYLARVVSILIFQKKKKKIGVFYTPKVVEGGEEEEEVVVVIVVSGL